MSEFVDRLSITDESGNIKKEININFGDPLARERSQKAMQTSEQAKQTASEAKQIAQEAKDAVPGQVSQQVEEATQELLESIQSVGVKDGVIQWTDNENFNKMLLYCAGWRNTTAGPGPIWDETLTLIAVKDYIQGRWGYSFSIRWSGGEIALVKGINRISKASEASVIEFYFNPDAFDYDYSDVSFNNNTQIRFNKELLISQPAISLLANNGGVIQWTNSNEVNKYIYALQRFKRESENYYNYKFIYRDGGLRFCAIRRSTGVLTAQSEILKVGYNRITGNAALGEIGLCITTTVIPPIEFQINEEIANVTQLASSYKAQTQSSAVNINEDYTATLASLKLLTGIAFPESKITYREQGSASVTAINSGLSENANLLKDNLDVVEVYKVDFSGMTTTRDLLGLKTGDWQITNPNTHRPLTAVLGIVGLENLASGKIAFQGTFNQMRNIRVIDFGDNTVANQVSLYYTFNGCYNLVSVDMSKYNGRITSMQGAFSFCHSLKFVKFPTKNMNYFSFGGQTFYECTALEILDLSSITCKCSSFNPGFKDCFLLTTINVNNWDFSECKIVDFTGASNLINLTGLTNIKISYSLSGNPLLTHESALNCIAGLYDLTEGGTVTEYTAQTLTFHPDVTAQLTEEEIAEATAKGWNIA